MLMRARPLRLPGLVLSLLVAASVVGAAQTPPPPAKRLPPAGIAISAEARAELTAGAAALRTQIDALAAELATVKKTQLAALLPDVEIFHKAVDWALRYDEFFEERQIAQARRALLTGNERLTQLRAGQTPWLDATGLVVRGYRSALDGSVQPYGLMVPPEIKRDAPSRLLVWLLGRGEKRTELAFLAERFTSAPPVTPRDTVILVPYGRFCNATKFAGEVDVFEALNATRGTYRIDDGRIMVGGFSMGGASTWHLATHHAGLWCAAAPGAGFAETAVYNNALAPGKPARTPWEQTLWRWYDATGYAANLFNLPVVAYSGELDRQKQAADIMAEAMAREALKLEHLIGPKTEHKYEPETKKVLTARLDALLDKGRDPEPREVHASTFTLRYPGRTWAQFEGLLQHWMRADIVARREGTESVVLSTKNTTGVKLTLPGVRRVVIDGQAIDVTPDAGTLSLHRAGDTWKTGTPPTGTRKRHGLTGPIDDAFMDKFLFVRPTAPPLNATVGAWVKAELAHATKMWRDIFRGDAPVKDDTAVTNDDIRSSNLILWGDPSSNKLISRISAQLPVKWDGRTLTFRGKTYESAHHAPILIFPNPLNPQRYVVLNSGIDFRDEAYGTNSLQTPKLPDYAIIDLREAPGPRWPGKIASAGFFDESWK